MSKIITLNRNGIFKRAFSKGRQFASPVLVTYIIRNRRKERRVGIITSKKIGTAVKRNRARRVIKEAYRLIFDNVLPGYDIVFVARGKTPFVKMGIVQKEMLVHLNKAGVIA